MSSFVNEVPFIALLSKVREFINTQQINSFQVALHKFLYTSNCLLHHVYNENILVPSLN